MMNTLYVQSLIYVVKVDFIGDNFEVIKRSIKDPLNHHKSSIIETIVDLRTRFAFGSLVDSLSLRLTSFRSTGFSIMQ